MEVRTLAAKLLPGLAIGGFTLTVFSTTAFAFFPPVPNGSGQVVTPPTVSPITPQPTTPVVPPIPPVVPPVVPPTKPHPVPTTHCVCVAPQQPCEVPEPMTIISSVIGLSAIGAMALRKKLSKTMDETTGDAA